VKVNILNIELSGMCILMATALRFLWRRRNKNLDKVPVEDMEEKNTIWGPKTIASSETLHYHPYYRYIL
jgi:hypothetical protein